MDIIVRFQQSNGHEHPNFKAAVQNYLSILSDLGLKAPERRAKLESLAVDRGLEPAEVQLVFVDLLPGGQ